MRQNPLSIFDCLCYTACVFIKNERTVLLLKKIVVLLMCLFVIVSLCSCGSFSVEKDTVVTESDTTLSESITEETTLEKTTSNETISEKVVSQPLKYGEKYYNSTLYSESRLDSKEYTAIAIFYENGTFSIDEMIDMEGDRCVYEGTYTIRGDMVICSPTTYHAKGMQMNDENELKPYDKKGNIDNPGNIEFSVVDGKLILGEYTQNYFNSSEKGDTFEIF